MAGQVAYVMAGGLRVLDLAAPFNPTQIGLYAIAGESLDVEGNLVFVAGSRLTAIDISDPTTPVFVGMVDLPSGSATTDVAVHGDLAHVSTQLGGLHVIDVSDPQNPGWTGTAPQPADRLNEYWVAAAAIADHVVSPRYYSGFDTFALCQGPIFADGFETGDTTAWTVTVP